MHVSQRQVVVTILDDPRPLAMVTAIRKSAAGRA